MICQVRAHPTIESRYLAAAAFIHSAIGLRKQRGLRRFRKIANTNRKRCPSLVISPGCLAPDRKGWGYIGPTWVLVAFQPRGIIYVTSCAMSNRTEKRWGASLQSQ